MCTIGTHTQDGALERMVGWIVVRGVSNTSDPISCVWKVHLYVGIIRRVFICRLTNTHTHRGSSAASCVWADEEGAHGRICSWCILKQTNPGSHHTTCTTHTSNFHILSLSESLTQNVTSAMIIGRDEYHTHTHTHTPGLLNRELEQHQLKTNHN